MENTYRQEIEQNGTGKVRIGIIGLGNMGAATIQGILASDIAGSVSLMASNRSEDATRAKLSRLGVDIADVAVAKDNPEIVTSSDMIIFAVKQTQLHDELQLWREQQVLHRDTLLVSFVAGVKISTIQRWVGNHYQPVARVMPNTPVASGCGFLGWAISEDASVRQQNILKDVLSGIGVEMQVRNDDEVDLVTAGAGSGPAYIFRFVEPMIEYYLQKGWSVDQAKKMIHRMVEGAATHLITTGEDAGVLRQKITSKGGTTEAALRVFDEAGIDAIIQKALDAAYKRAGELGEQFDTQ